MKQYDMKDAFPESTEKFHERVMQTLDALPERKGNIIIMEDKRKKAWSFRKIMVASLIAVMALGTTVFAASQISSYVGSSSEKPIYTSMPTIEQVQADFGFAPKLVESFSNGYNFKEASKGKIEALDEDGNVVGNSKQLICNYEKEKSCMSLYIFNGFDADSGNDFAADTRQIGEITVNYSDQLYVSVPDDYVKTEQDILDEQAGKKMFAYGGFAEISEATVQFVSWVDNGCTYNFIVNDSGLSEDELLAMAQEIIDCEN